MIRMIDSEDSFLGHDNIGNLNEFTIVEHAEAVIVLKGSKSKITHLSLPQKDPKQHQSGITCTKGKLQGYGPKVQLNEDLIKNHRLFQSYCIKIDMRQIQHLRWLIITFKKT